MALLAPVLMAAALALPARGAEPPWRFVVMGDTRDATTDTRTGISPELPALARAIAAEGPDLVLHTGDLANGYYTTRSSPVHDRFIEMLRAWKSAVRPLLDVAPIYCVRGNHEDGEIVTDRALRAAYLAEIGAALPQDGPPRERGLTYSVTHKGARFIALDAYREKSAGMVRGYVDEKWLDAALARDRRPFTFVFSHTPAFRVGDSHGSPFPNLYSHTRDRDRLWASLKRANVLAYFCGHIHFYCRGTANGIEQVVVGNGGANTVDFEPSKVDPAVAIHSPARRVPAADVPAGYVVVTVDEKAGTATGVQKLLDPRTGVVTAGDTFTLRLR